MIGVVLTHWKRGPKLLLEQAKAVEQQSPPKDIFLWDNGTSSALASVYMVHIRCSYNMGVWPRFLFAMSLPHEYVCIFDDDTIPGKYWFENCLKTLDALDGKAICGAAGVTFPECNRFPRLYHGWSNPKDEITEVDLIGHSWFMRRDVLWECFGGHIPPVIVPTAGEDYHLSVGAKMKGYKVVVPPHPPEHREWWGSLEGEQGMDDVALWKQMGEEEKKEHIHNEYRRRGWQPLATPSYRQVAH